MNADSRIFDAARETYLSRATSEPQWRDLYRQSVDLVMTALAPTEHQRLLHYIGQFSVLNASFVVQRLAEVHALSLYPEANAELTAARRLAAAANLAALRRDFITVPPGEEEGQCPADAPQRVFKAALRRRQGLPGETPPAFRAMTAQCIEQVMESFSATQRAQMHNLFEQFSVAGMEQVLRLWLWVQGEESLRATLAQRQYAQWRATGDESHWWRYPQGEAWIYI